MPEVASPVLAPGARVVIILEPVHDPAHPARLDRHPAGAPPHPDQPQPVPLLRQGNHLDLHPEAGRRVRHLRNGHRGVLDTNVVVSGLIWGGPPRGLLDLARRGRLPALAIQRTGHAALPGGRRATRWTVHKEPIRLRAVRPALAHVGGDLRCVRRSCPLDARQFIIYS